MPRQGPWERSLAVAGHLKMKLDWKSRVVRLGRLEKAFLALLAGSVLLSFAWPGSVALALTELALVIVGFGIAGRLITAGTKRAIWRLRNRLIATYLFIAVVPVFLILVLAALGSYALITQMAVYLAISDLDRRAVVLRDIAETTAQTDAGMRQEMLSRIALTHRTRFPGLMVIASTGDSVESWPPHVQVGPPPASWKDTSGVVERKGAFFLWAHTNSGDTSVTALQPLSRIYLSHMIPGLGDVSLMSFGDEKSKFVVQNENGKETRVTFSNEPPADELPPARGRFDLDMNWFATVPVWRWNTPEKKDVTLLYVHTRPSAVLNTIFNTSVDSISGVMPVALLVVSILFLVVESIALVIGVSLARTITRAVHNLYEGTQRVIEGDFSHRIAVHGKDQLSSLSSSFNAMTQNLEKLLIVAKEKERLETELEIAREVQSQLYPKTTPTLKTLRITGVCQPARMVAGDYYDYLCINDQKLALAIGDVAGKGISAALLMATIQAGLRMELRTTRVLAAPGSHNGHVQIPTSRVVWELNQQLYATTTPEKYATFFFALYDESSSDLSYTNAGHLPPLLVRSGTAVRLQVNGTVVGAFPGAHYDESWLHMESGDLLVCYTDGITEPENEYGEMFGEERLIELVTKNADRDDSKIVAQILDAVHQWTSAAEQPDDMTLLLARRL